MKIGIDISQLAFPGTGVANYLRQLIEEMIALDSKNDYVLFFSSLRGSLPKDFLELVTKRKNVHLKQFKLPPVALDVLWNKLHKLPIEAFVGNVDLFITSDWTEPPAKKAKKATILYDLIVYKHPEETAALIVETQKRKLRWVKTESDMVLCISKATKEDAKDILGIEDTKLAVIYPGLTL